MELSQITYDLCRFYLQDRKDTLPENCFNRLHGLVRARDYQSLATCWSDSTHDLTGVEANRTLRQVEAFFKKNAAFTDGQSARLSALISFEEGESLCEKTNNRLDTFFCKRSHENVTDLAMKVKRCQRYIDRTLGSFRDFLEELPKLIYVTAGATVTRPRRSALPFLKVSKRLVCTPGAYPYISLLSDFFGYGEIQGKLVNENRVTFVPKSWKTERTIACEAEGNMVLQLAFDKYAKRRLRRVGINLHDQTRNQELAKEGSIHGNFATIDLSMASDTLAYNTVALLFPEEWFQYLRAIRSQKYTLYPGQKEDYHKFSSMGNGSTFPVETLVFAAACSAVGSTAYSVYGDDIIIEHDLAEPLIELLAFLGFVPNTNKSYFSGPFRESCGRDWYGGVDITPQYLRGADSRKATWCHIVNSMMLVSVPYGALQDYLADLVLARKLPLVPYNKDSMSGVWVDPHTAYERKLIRTARKGRHAWIPMFKAYQPQTSYRRVHDSRSLFLWHLGALGRIRGTFLPLRKLGLKYLNMQASDPYDQGESSRYSTSSHKYVRKWIHWIPVAGASDKLSSLSGLISLRLSD